MSEKTSNRSLIEKDKHYYLPTFKRFPIAFRKGKGTRLWDVEGNEYLDVLAGIAVNNLGHCHPKVVRAIQEQAAQLIAVSNFFVSEAQVALAEKLVNKSGLSTAFFTNSGAESVEGAFKIARKYAHSVGRGGGIIAMHQSFHGRTLATIATGKEKMQRGFGPIPQGFYRVPFNNLAAVTSILNRDIGAIILEPIQGEGGIIPAEPGYLASLRKLCDQENIVLIFDEIQCGIARTGEFFAKDHYGIQPDIMTLAKGLGNGMPMGAILSNEKVSQTIEYGDHGTTFGGNPLACAAGLATIATIEEENITERAARLGTVLRDMLTEALKNRPGFREIRGLGLMIGVEFDFEVKPLVVEMMKNKVIANATAQHVLRLVPPLIISEDELRLLTDTITRSLDQIEKER